MFGSQGAELVAIQAQKVEDHFQTSSQQMESHIEAPKMVQKQQKENCVAVAPEDQKCCSLQNSEDSPSDHPKDEL